MLAYYMKTHPGVPDRGLVLQLLADFPGDRDAMLAMLQKQLGNAYVQDLVAQPAPAAAAAAAPAKAAVAPTAAPTTAPTTTTTTTAAPTSTAPAPGVHVSLSGPNGPSAEAAGSFKNGGWSGDGSATANTSGASAQGEVDYVNANGNTFKQTATASSSSGGLTTSGAGSFDKGTVKVDDTLTANGSGVTGKADLNVANKTGNLTETVTGDSSKKTVQATGSGAITSGALTGLSETNKVTVDSTGVAGELDGKYVNGATTVTQSITGSTATGTVGTTGTLTTSSGDNSFKNTNAVTDTKGVITGTDTFNWQNTAGNSATQTFNGNLSTDVFGTTGNELFKSGVNTFKNTNAFTDTKGVLSGNDTLDWTNKAGNEVSQTVSGDAGTGVVGTNGFELFKDGANTFKNTNAFTDTKGIFGGTDTFDWTNSKSGNEVNQTVNGNAGTGVIGTSGFELFKNGTDTFKNTNSFTDTKGIFGGSDTFDWTNSKSGNEVSQTVDGNAGTGVIGTNGLELFKDGANTFKNTNALTDTKGIFSGSDTFDWTNSKSGNEINQQVTGNAGTGVIGTSGFELFKNGTDTFKNTNSFTDTKGVASGTDTFDWTNSKTGNEINQTVNGNAGTGVIGTSGFELFKNGTDTFKNTNSVTDTKGAYTGSDTFDFSNSKSGTDITQGFNFNTGTNTYGTSGTQKFTAPSGDIWTLGNQLTDADGALSGKGTADVKTKDGTDVSGYGGAASDGTFNFGGAQTFKGFGLFNGDTVTGSNSATGGDGQFGGKGSLDFTQKNGDTFGGFIDGQSQTGTFDAGVDLKSKSGWNFTQAVGTANGDPTSTGTLSHGIGKYGSVNVAGNADYGKNMYTGSVGYGGPSDGLLKGFSASANGSIDGGVITQGGTVTDNHTFKNGGVLTGTGTFGYNGTNGFRDVGNVDYHQALNKTTNADVGAEVNIGSTVGGYAVDAYGALSHTTKNGDTVTGAADIGVQNGVAFGGVGGGWDSKAKDSDGQAKNSLHAAAMVNNFGPAVGVGGEIAGKVRFRIVLQDFQVVELSVQIPGHHPIANTLLTVGSIATTIGLGGVGFAIGAIEKLLGKGHIPGMDKLLQTVGGNPEAKITDANGTTDSKAAATLPKMVAVLTEEDYASLGDMHMLTAAGAVDGTVAPDLFKERVALSGLEASQQEALMAAYKAASKKQKHAKTSHASAVSDVNTLISSGDKDVDKFAAILDSHPGDMPVLLQVIGDAPGYGASFANEVAKAAGVRDQVVITSDGTVQFTSPLPAKVVKPSTPAPAPAPTTADTESTELTENKPETEQN